jgi:hypothetical protein
MARVVARCAALLAASLLTTAASPGGYAPPALAGPAPPLVAIAPKPAPPAAVAPPVFVPAPMPDLEFEDNAQQKRGPAGVELSPNLYHPHQGYLGDGYTPNSTIEGEQNRRLRPMPELNLSVPLQ